MNDFNPARDAVRLRKAGKIAAALRTAGATTADFPLTTITWSLAIQVAAVPAPSEETKALVKSMLAIAELPAPADPFAGLS